MVDGMKFAARAVLSSICVGWRLQQTLYLFVMIYHYIEGTQLIKLIKRHIITITSYQIDKSGAQN